MSRELDYIEDLETCRNQDPVKLYKKLEKWISNSNFIRIVDGKIRERIKKTQDVVNDRLEERSEVIEVCLASIIIGEPIVLFGPPGTGKSMIVREIAKCCETKIPDEKDEGKTRSNYFEYLMNSHTMPEEIFGAADIEQLKKASKFVRNTEGMLPTAEFAFLDELFRAKGHILNTLLTILNERIFHNGGEITRVPLIGVITAANHPPTDPEVDAIFDRFPIRVHVESIFNDYEIEASAVGQALLTKAIDHVDRNASHQQQEQLVCSNHFRIVQWSLLERSNVPKQASPRFEEFMDLFEEMRFEHNLSDRSFGKLWRFGIALDWLNSRPPEGHFHNAPKDKKSQGHLEVFKYIGATRGMASEAANTVMEKLGEQGFISTH